MPAFLIAWALKAGIPAKYAKIAVIGALVTLLIVGLGVAKCAYDRHVISQHEQKAALEQAKRERRADTNLQQQIGRDNAASEQRKQEIEDATRNIPDQAPSARQRAIACAELVRQAKERGKPRPAC